MRHEYLLHAREKLLELLGLRARVWRVQIVLEEEGEQQALADGLLKVTADRAPNHVIAVVEAAVLCSVRTASGREG